MGPVRYPVLSTAFPGLVLMAVSVPVVFASIELSGTTSNSLTMPGRCDCCHTEYTEMESASGMSAAVTTKPIYGCFMGKSGTGNTVFLYCCLCSVCCFGHD